LPDARHDDLHLSRSQGDHRVRVPVQPGAIMEFHHQRALASFGEQIGELPDGARMEMAGRIFYRYAAQHRSLGCRSENREHERKQYAKTFLMHGDPFGLYCDIVALLPQCWANDS